MTKEEGKTQIYRCMYGSWQNMNTPKRKRPLASVVLEEGVAERIIKDLEEFSRSGKWYYDRGIPYRRGYLLHGPPGTGKSSFCMALAGHFDLNICVCNLSDKSLNDETFNQLLANVNPDSIILLEDVDAAFVDRDTVVEADANKSTAFDGMNRLTFSGFLNALDGVCSGEGRILFMTTNYVDRLDRALLRPGRIDVKEKIGHATRPQLEKIYAHFYADESRENAVRFADAAMKVSTELSLAQVQGLFLLHKHAPEQVFHNLHLLAREVKDKNDLKNLIIDDS